MVQAPQKRGVRFYYGLDIIMLAVVLIELSSEERALGSLRSETAVLYRAARRTLAGGVSDVRRIADRVLLIFYLLLCAHYGWL